MLRHLQLTSVRSVLDIGCGLGEFLEQVGRMHPRIEMAGIDIDERCLAVAREHVDARFVKAAVERLPFGDESYDLVTAIDVIEHLENPMQFLREALRVTRAQAVFVTPNLGRPARVLAAARRRELREARGHKQGWDYHLFKQVLEVAGWRVDKIVTRFVDFPLYAFLPRRVGQFMSYRVLRRLFPMLGSELFAFCSKPEVGDQCE